MVAMARTWWNRSLRRTKTVIVLLITIYGVVLYGTQVYTSDQLESEALHV